MWVILGTDFHRENENWNHRESSAFLTILSQYINVKRGILDTVEKEMSVLL